MTAKSVGSILIGVPTVNAHKPRRLVRMPKPIDNAPKRVGKTKSGHDARLSAPGSRRKSYALLLKQLAEPRRKRGMPRKKRDMPPKPRGKNPGDCAKNSRRKWQS